MTSTGIPKTGMNLLPLFSPHRSPNASGVTYQTPSLPARESELSQKPYIRRLRLLTAHSLNNMSIGRITFWENDLTHPGKRALFLSEVKRNAPWILEERSSQSDSPAHSEWDLALQNWLTAAAVDTSVRGMLRELLEHPEFNHHIVSSMQLYAESGGGPGHSALIALASQADPKLILVQRANIDPTKHGWEIYLGLILCTLHIFYFEPITIPTLDDPAFNDDETNIPALVAENLAVEFEDIDLRGMEGAIQEAIVNVEDLFEYFYQTQPGLSYDRREFGRILGKLTAVQGTDPIPFTEDEISLMDNAMSAPIPTILEAIGYLAQTCSPYYREVLERFTDSTLWDSVAEDILEEID